MLGRVPDCRRVPYALGVNRILQGFAFPARTPFLARGQPNGITVAAYTPHAARVKVNRLGRDYRTSRCRTTRPVPLPVRRTGGKVKAPTAHSVLKGFRFTGLVLGTKPGEAIVLVIRAKAFSSCH